MQKTLLITGAVLFALLHVHLTYADFGPGPDEEEIEHARLRYVQMREQMGDAAFKAHTLAILKHLLDRHHPAHPRYKELGQQLGTPEHTLRTNPYFFRHVVPMLVEMKADEALPILAEHIKILEHRWRHRESKTGRLGYWLDDDRVQVEKAWFELSSEQHDIDEITKQLTEMTSQPRAVWRKVTYLIDQVEKGNQDIGWMYLEVSLDKPDEDEPYKLFLQLATMRTGFLGQGTAIGLIDHIASKNLWTLDEHTLEEALKHDDIRIRVAAASIVYRQNVLVPGALDIEFPEPLILNDELNALHAKMNVAREARQKLESVWKELLQQRQTLHQQIPVQQPDENHGDFWGRQMAFQEVLNQNTNLLIHCYRLAAFGTLDKQLLDLCIDSVGYVGAFAWIKQNHQSGNIKLTDEQFARLTAWINNPYAPESRRLSIIEGLIRIDYRPAANEIVKFYQSQGLLDGLRPTPKVTIFRDGTTNAVMLSKEWLDWLYKHADGPRLQ